MMSAAVIAQFSLAFLLLTTAALLTRSLLKAIDANPGFHPDHVVSAQIAGFFYRLLSRISALPGVRQTGAMSDLPMGSTSNVIISIEGYLGNTERVDTVFCRGNALESLSVALLRGRLLQPEDQLGKPHAVVISEALAKRAWPHGDPIGGRIRFGVDVPNNSEPWLTVVGVVSDMKAWLNSDSARLLLFMTWLDWVNQMDVVVRASGDPLLLASARRRGISRVDPSLPVGRIEKLDQVLEKSLSAERFRTGLLICFAIAALLLAMLGVAGSLAYNTAHRTHEFGVRIAMGADRRALLLLVLAHCFRLSRTGIAVGLLASIFATRALASLLYDTSPHDLETFIGRSFDLGIGRITRQYVSGVARDPYGPDHRFASRMKPGNADSTAHPVRGRFALRRGRGGVTKRFFWATTCVPLCDRSV